MSHYKDPRSSIKGDSAVYIRVYADLSYHQNRLYSHVFLHVEPLFNSYRLQELRNSGIANAGQFDGITESSMPYSATAARSLFSMTYFGQAEDILQANTRS